MEEKKEESNWFQSIAKNFVDNNTAKPNSLADALAALSYRKTGQYFLNQLIYIDDYIFEKCRFDGCRLITYKGTFKFIHCVISANTIVEYGGEAFKIAKLFNSMTSHKDAYPNFKITLNNDGTFTLE